MPRLQVRFSDREVGELSHDHGRLCLAYAPEARPISLRLPVTTAPYDDAACGAFFRNLLPEGGFRAALCRALALPDADDFGLLTALGAECAGAIELQASGDSPGYTPISEAKLRLWLRDVHARPSPRQAPGLGFALAGAQDKLAVHVVDGEPYLCERGAPSTLILKPDIASGFDRVELSALNELSCMQLARVVGLRVPATSYRFGAFAIERFDRVSRKSALVRLHQEDFAQLLGLPPSAKYDITWRQCFDLVDRHVAEAEGARRELVDRLLFNLFIGNGDAHGKNFALLFTEQGPELAPAYDLLCTQLYPSLSEAFSMRIGPARRQEELTALAWQTLASEARLPLEDVRARGAELASAVEHALRELPLHIISQNPSLQTDVYPARRRDDFFRKLVDVITGNCKRIARSLLARA